MCMGFRIPGTGFRIRVGVFESRGTVLYGVGFSTYTYLTIDGVKIRVLGYTPEIFSLWLHSALRALTFHTLS